MRRQRDLVCIVCGKEFKGAASAITCSGACRFELARLKKANQRPSFLLIAKGKGQKIPDLNAPKRLKFKKGEKKKNYEILESKIEWAAPTKESYDAKSISRFVLDEVGKTEIAEPLTKEQKLSKIAELNEEIRKIEKESLPPGMLPKRHFLDKAMRIDAINELKKQL